ncbi:MAG: adenylate/guanylate cyclase domain-containing protein [Rhodospirillales bacterium]|nr:adenylate/guanylate cyclase domain-containing protein [Rhodospirillales bacterium]
MAQSRRTVTYEVHVRWGSRWEIHARFEADGRNRALAQAKSVNRRSGIRAVRVVKEIYDPAVGIAQEFIVYKSRMPGRPVAGRNAGTARRPLLRRSLDHILAAPPAMGNILASLLQTVVQSPHWAILPRALLGTFAAFFSAVLVTGIAAYALDGASPAASPQRGGGLGILLFVFAGIFLVGALAAAFALTTGASRPFSAFIWSRGAPPTRLRRLPAVGSSSALRRRTGAPRPPPQRRAVGPPTLPQPAEELRGLLVQYLRQVIQPARGAYDLGDSYIRFGINLFVAGACESLCQKKDVDMPTTVVIMAAGLRAVGVEADHAASLAANYVEYLISDPRYMAMFGHGRRAVLAHLAGRADSTDMLWRALDEWTLSQARKDARGLVTIMFTRMIGFEDIVGARGDEKARRIAHDHNQMVEHRLIEFRGKRIKHIDSGTMAAFMNGLDAVRAASAIRADFLEYTRQIPDHPLSIGIGLNCGQPIAEGNDLFGSSVQLAARIAGVAKAGQVLVSLALREQLDAEAPKTSFRPCGPFDLKGFETPVPLYEATGL